MAWIALGEEAQREGLQRNGFLEVHAADGIFKIDALAAFRPAAATRVSGILEEVEHPVRESINARETFKVRGRVHFQIDPAKSRYVSLTPLGASIASATTITATDGSFDFSAVQRGHYMLSTSYPHRSATPWRLAHFATSVVVDSDLDLGVIRPLNDEAFLSQTLDRNETLVTVTVTVMRGGEPASGVQVMAEEEGWIHPLDSKRTDYRGQATLEWTEGPAAVRVLALERDGTVLGSTPDSRQYPAGRETTVRIRAETGALELHLPLAFVIPDETVLQVLLEGGKISPRAAPCESIHKLDSARSNASAKPCDAYFDELPGGMYNVRTIQLKKFEKLGWRSLGEGPSGSVTVVPGETVALRL